MSSTGRNSNHTAQSPVVGRTSIAQPEKTPLLWPHRRAPADLQPRETAVSVQRVRAAAMFPAPSENTPGKNHADAGREGDGRALLARVALLFERGPGGRPGR